MENKNKLILIFDLLVVGVIVLFSVILFSSLFIKAKKMPDTVDLTLKVTSDQAIESEAGKQAIVYYNSINTPVNMKKIEKADGSLFITLESSGKITSDRFIFNSQRVLIGQKGEIHSTYFAQGIVVNVSKVN